MPLSIQLVSRPARVARLVALVGIVTLLAGALALGAHPLASLAAPAALLATGLVLGVLAPVYGLAASVGLWAARLGIVVGAVALLLPDGRAATALLVVAALVVLAGLRVVARGVRRVGDLPVWSCAVVAAGAAAVLLVPGLGGGLVLGLAWLAVAGAIHATSVAPATSAA